MSAGRGARNKAREPLREPEAELIRELTGGGTDQSAPVPVSHDTPPLENPNPQPPSSSSSLPGQQRPVARGRACGRVNPKSKPSEEPQQPGGLCATAASVPEEPSESSPQFESADRPHTPTAEPPPPSSLPLSPDTTCANSESIPLASEIKEAVSKGTKVANEAQPVSPESPGTTKMNPNAPTFVPGNSLAAVIPPGVSPSFPTKHPPVANSDSEQRALNPNVKEFVPSIKTSPKLNASAKDFVPGRLIIENGDPSEVLFEEIDAEPPQQEFIELAIQDPQYLVDSFTEPATVLDGEVDYTRVLQYCAEILVKATLYPDSFEHHQQMLQVMMSSQKLSAEAQSNLAEMLIHWGITESWLYYTSCKISDVLCNQDSDFMKKYLTRLKSWFDVKKDLPTGTTEEESYTFLNFCMFLAEMFSRIKMNGEPVYVLGQGVFEMLTRLLEIGDGICVGGACNILKLTGALLGNCKGGNEKMEKIISTVKILSEKQPHLDSKSHVLMQQVLQLHGSKWGSEATPTPAAQMASAYDDADAPPFQQPVTNPEDWNEFFLEDQYYDETDNFDGNVDPEIEQEYEAFIEEMEEHLMRQELGEELGD